MRPLTQRCSKVFPALAGFQSMPRWLIPPVSVTIMKLTAGGSLLDRNFAIPWAPGPPGLPQICFVRNLTPGTKKSDHDFGFKSRAKEPPWNRKCCRLLVAEICENFLRSTPRCYAKAGHAPAGYSSSYYVNGPLHRSVCDFYLRSFS